MELVIAAAAFVLGGLAGFFLAPRSNASGARLQGKCDALVDQLAQAQKILDETQRELRGKSERAAALESTQKALEEKITQMQEQFKAQFENLAGKLFEENRTKFTQQSTTSLQEMLNPLKERFAEFQKKVDESFGAHFRNQTTLKDEIQRIVLQTDSLTKALKGDVKAQGNWGEIILERILEEAGLQKPRDYVVQGEGLSIKAGDGSHQKPDVIINLPSGSHVIIDSKVSLTHYERYCAEGDDAARAALLKQYLASIRKHATDLAARRYQESDKLTSPDFVLMFMPIEGAYSLAIQQDRELHSFAWDKKVAIVCPTTLFVALQTIASQWKIETQNRNVQEIARQGGALYDKIAGFVEDMDAVGAQLERMQKSYDAAMNKLSTGKGNILSRTENLKKLGANASKNLTKSGSEEDEGAELTLLERAQS